MQNVMNRFLTAEQRSKDLVKKAEAEREDMISKAQAEARAAVERFSEGIPALRNSYKDEKQAHRTLREMRRHFDERRREPRTLAEVSPGARISQWPAAR